MTSVAPAIFPPSRHHHPNHHHHQQQQQQPEHHNNHQHVQRDDKFPIRSIHYAVTLFVYRVFDGGGEMRPFEGDTPDEYSRTTREHCQYDSLLYGDAKHLSHHGLLLQGRLAQVPTETQGTGKLDALSGVNR